MKSIMIAIGSGIILGVAYFFTISSADAGTCISTWTVSLSLESIEVDGESIDAYNVDKVPWPSQATTNVYAGDAPRNEFTSHGQIDLPMCFEYERD